MMTLTDMIIIIHPVSGGSTGLITVGIITILFIQIITGTIIIQFTGV